MRAFDDLLIVIPCLDEARTLPALIAQFANEAPGATIVVADGGSTDGSPDAVIEAAVLFPQVKLLSNPARLQSAGVNRAAATFGEGRVWLLRVDAHCAYPLGYAATLLNAAAREKADSVVVPMLTRGSACMQRAIAAAQNSRLGTGGSPHRHLSEGQFVDHGHHALFRLAHFTAVGGYDESFSHNEDAELDCRLVQHGARIWLEPAACITYFPRRTLWALFRQYRAYGRGRSRTVRKHGLKLKRRQQLPLLIAPAAVVGGFAVVLGTVWPFALLFAIPAMVWLVASTVYGLALAIDRRDPCVALAGPAAATMHLAWSIGYWEMMGRGGRARDVRVSN